MKARRKIIEIDEELCDGCGQCVIACAEGALEIIGGKARVISENLCDGIGACIGECPQGALTVVEREAEEFDPEAVEAHLEQMEKTPSAEAQTGAFSCPASGIQTFETSREKSRAPVSEAEEKSRLSHWPVQIRLVPANAPFLRGADLLVLADCAAVAYPLLHTELLAGRAVMMGCPKFDDADAYVQKFADLIDQAEPNSITVVTMEVPCCSGLPGIVKKGMAAAEKKVDMREIVVSPKGAILSDTAASRPE
jgi:NAD-dependent dihydropyrimidine dehydrogenase PreA subunit